MGRGWRAILALAYGAALAAIAKLAWEGWSFYRTPLLERPHHPDFFALKPGGSLGHTLGVVGAALLVVMLAYSLRKRVPALAAWGPLRAWLDVHIFCGIVGTLLVVLHSTFKVHGLVALSFWSMVVVALSGVVGRYLYLQIPRSRVGDELTLAEVEEDLAAIGARLRGRFGLGEADLARLHEVAAVGTARPLPLLVLTLPLAGLRLRWRVRRELRRLERPGAPLGALGRAVRQRAVLERRILLWSQMQQLFHYWHVLHKPFAVVMYLFFALHLAIVVLAGYAWVG